GIGGWSVPLDHRRRDARLDSGNVGATAGAEAVGGSDRLSTARAGGGGRHRLGVGESPANIHRPVRLDSAPAAVRPRFRAAPRGSTRAPRRAWGEGCGAPSPPESLDPPAPAPPPSP